MGPDVHRHHPGRPADAGPVAARHQPDGQRPEPGPARPRPVLRARPRAEPRPRCRRLVAHRRQLHRATHRYRWRTADSGLPRRRRGAARRQSRGLGPPGHDRRHPVRAGPHLRPDRAVPSGEHGARHRQRGAGRIVDRARRRRAHRDDLRSVGRRPHHRHRRGIEAKPSSRKPAGHDPHRVERRRHRRPGPARRVPALPHTQRRARPHVLSGHQTARAGSTSAGPRAVRLRPLRRRHSRRFRPERWTPRPGRRACSSCPTSSSPAGEHPDNPVLAAVGTPRGATASATNCSTTSWRPCGWI